jgi:hypothetical protein
MLSGLLDIQAEAEFENIQYAPSMSLKSPPVSFCALPLHYFYRTYLNFV